MHCIRRFVFLLLFSALGNGLAAQDTQPQPGPVPLVPADVIDLSAQVSVELSQGQVSEAVVEKQGSIIESLGRLLAGASSKTGDLPEAVSSRRPAPAAGNQPAGKGSQQGGASSSAGAQSGADSNGTPSAAPPPNLGDLKHREGLADAVWGHLPPRIRDELYRSYTERYLPQYDGLLRRYFEALAESTSQPAAER